MLRTLLLLTLAIAAGAQDCPVKITHFIVNQNTRWNYTALMLSFTNTSGKRIIETNFGAVVLDAAGEAHPLLAELRSGKKINPGDKVSRQQLGPIGREALDPHTEVKIRTWPQTVQFEDGTNWKDDGTHVCAVEGH